jgi:capsular polysaccharide biosynthesis protein
MENYFNNTNLVNLLFKWRIHLMVILGVAVVLAIIFSGPFFITPKYKSFAVAYPANVSPYSEESETEQMFQILQSQDIMDSVINKFDLSAHYEIERDYKYFKTAIYYEFSQNVKIQKTPYDAVSIEVLDKDPFMAASITEAIIDFYNTKVQRMHKSKYVEVINMYEILLSNKAKTIDSLKKALYELSVESGLLSYEQSSEEIMRGYLRTVIGGGGSANINTAEVKRLKENMERKGGELIMLVESIKNEARTYADFKVEYEDALRFNNAQLTYSNVITHPFPADKKSYPIRWLIVVMTFVLTFFFAIVVILLVENLRVYRIRKQQNLQKH